jgi:hypothetical protein
MLRPLLPAAAPYALSGEVGVNVGVRRVDPERPGQGPEYWLFRINSLTHRMPVCPLGPDCDRIGVWGGTLCALEPSADRQTTVHQFEAEITAVRAGFGEDSVFVGLANGGLFHVTVPGGT